jgi:hypothetical protein
MFLLCCVFNPTNPNPNPNPNQFDQEDVSSFFRHEPDRDFILYLVLNRRDNFRRNLQSLQRLSHVRSWHDISRSAKIECILLCGASFVHHAQVSAGFENWRGHVQ